MGDWGLSPLPPHLLGVLSPLFFYRILRKFFIFPQSTHQDFTTIFVQNFNCHFCQFSKSSHFSKVSCIFEPFFFHRTTVKWLWSRVLNVFGNFNVWSNQTYLRFSAITSQLFQVMCSMYPGINLELNQHFKYKKTKLNLCHHMLTSSTQMQNSSFHVAEWTRTSTNCQKNEKCTCKTQKKLLYFIVKYANVWRSCCLRCPGC